MIAGMITRQKMDAIMMPILCVNMPYSKNTSINAINIRQMTAATLL